jgi:DNA-binding NarL/FixJ family response regulator
MVRTYGTAYFTMKKIRVLLADDHQIMIEGLKKLLEPHFEIATTVEDGKKLYDEAKQINPDVIVLDISMPGLDGLEAALLLKKDFPRAKIIFLTMHDESAYVRNCFRVGARGYVLKRCASAELVDAIQQVYRGRTYVTAEITRNIETMGLLVADPTAVLTKREREVLRAVAEGKSGKEIASLLKISPKTATFHKSRVMRKLGLRTTADLTRFAVRHGFVD